jgi:hypothetical protein
MTMNYSKLMSSDSRLHHFVVHSADANVLLSVWFSLLRLLYGVTDQVPHFPASEFFVKVTLFTALSPSSNCNKTGAKSSM